MTGKPLAVLIVEDSESDAELIVRLLQKAGYDVVSERVDTADAMRAALSKRTWDIVISDSRMPQFDALAALMLLQEMGLDIPFIIVSGVIGEETAVAMMKAGAHDYLMKGNLARLGPAVERELCQAKSRRERKRAEEALEQERTLLSAMIDTIPDQIYFKDKDSRFLRVNQKEARLFGLSDPAQAIGKSDADFFSAEYARQALADEQGIIRTGQAFVGVEEKETWPDGSESWISTTKIPLRDREGQIIGTCGISRSITERKRSEEALRASEERYRMLAENMSDTLWLMDMDLHTTYISPSVIRLRGYTLDETAALPLDRQLTPESLSRAMKLFSETLTPENLARSDPVLSRTIELEYYRKDGSTYWSENVFTLIRDQNGQPVSILGVGRDITERKRSEEQIRRQLQQLAALRTIDNAIRGSLDLRLTLAIILRETIAQMNVDAARILLLNPPSQMLECAAGSGFLTDAPQQTSLRLGEGFAGQAALERRTVFIPNLRGRKTGLLKSQQFAAENFVTSCAVPLVAKGQVKGVLEVFLRHALPPGSGGGEWQNFLETIGEQTAIAVENSQLFNDLQHSSRELALGYDETIAGWSRALDLREKETEGHTLRVTEMTIRLAQALGVDNTEIQHIRRGALLHDIGKMGVPEAILLQPDKLTEEETGIKSRHPVFANEMLSSIAFLRPALDIPYCHHEKWDGSGYPRGLQGEQIPLAARIFSVADVWDALTNDRPNQAAWPKKKAREYLQAQSGKDFDPQVVEIFLKIGEDQ